MKTGQNCPKIKSSPGQNFEGREVSEMIKNHNFEGKIAIPGSFDEKPFKNGQKVT